jgi:hypothetical protein
LEGLRENLEKVVVDAEGYVWVFQDYCGRNLGYRGWSFPLDDKQSNYLCNDKSWLYPSGVKTYDSRYITTNTAFIAANSKYFLWTGDIVFLKNNIARIRKAMEFLISQQESESKAIIKTNWPGHDGIGSKKGSGIGLDLLSFGNRDMQATIQYYHALLEQVELEKSIALHPEWNISAPSAVTTATRLSERAAKVKLSASTFFWINPDNLSNSSDFNYGRFYATEDIAGNKHDYGFLQLNHGGCS